MTLTILPKAFADQADIQTILGFTLQRLNYKPHKTLIFNLRVHSKDCSFDAQNPFELYYSHSDGQRSDLSRSSQYYFFPIEVKPLDAWQIEFEFRHFKELLKNTVPSKAISYLDSNKKCQAYIVSEYQNSFYLLKKIIMFFDLFLGFIKDVNYMLIDAHLLEKSPQRPFLFKDLPATKLLCIKGDCPK